MMAKGHGGLFVFEGPDATGKSSISLGFGQFLRDLGYRCKNLSFPGKTPGSLGRHIYDLHHEPSKLGVLRIEPAALQALHVAAHIDEIKSRIIPTIKSGESVVLDRFWWSLVVYGRSEGVDETLIQRMKELELATWGEIRPTAAFLLTRKKPLRNEAMGKWQKLGQGYSDLFLEECVKYPTKRLNNDSSLEDCLACAKATFLSLVNSHSTKRRRQATNRNNLTVFSSISPAKPTPVYDTYWKFAAERQNIFFKRWNADAPPWTSDEILREHKFTNAYRASDRVSQFLIKEVIYKGDPNPEETFFRILIFKIFNKISTWDLLNRSLGTVTYKEFRIKDYDRLLCSAMESGSKIFSGAYIMPSGTKTYRSSRKHQSYLQLIKKMMEDRVASRISEMRGMKEAFELLRSYPMIGDFLAYQFATDINYSEISDFGEMEFVTPGPGALDGIRKCFDSLGGLSERDIIKVVTARQESEFQRLNIVFRSLWGRPLQLVDCQNLFCEVDKYARVRHPNYSGISGRKKIKQKFVQNKSQIDLWYPPKWKINRLIRQEE